jgi:hypothetical protein
MLQTRRGSGYLLYAGEENAGAGNGKGGKPSTSGGTRKLHA